MDKAFLNDVRKIKEIKKLSNKCLKIYKSLDVNTKNYFIDIFMWYGEFGIEYKLDEIIELLNNSTNWLNNELKQTNIKNSDLKIFWESIK